jgi:hypothetical protein
MIIVEETVIIELPVILGILHPIIIMNCLLPFVPLLVNFEKIITWNGFEK